MAGELDVFRDYDTSRSCRSNHSLEGRFRCGQVGQQKASENKVIGRAIFEITGTSCSEVDIQPTPVGFRAGQAHAALVEIDPRDTARRLHGFRHAECNRSDSTPHVQTAHPRTQPGPVQQGLRRGPFHGSQKLQSLRSMIAASKDVVGGFWMRHVCASSLPKT